METRSKRRKMTFTTVGGSSILTIFAVLCFVIFALLSLSTATANSTLTNKSIDGVTQYYKADTEAEEILAKLRAGQAPVGVTIYKAETTKDGVKRIVADGVGYTDWDEYASYTCEIDENQELQVEVLLRFDDSEAYRVITWNKVYTSEWEADDSMNVYVPEDGEDDGNNDQTGDDGSGFVTIDE